MLSIIYYVMLRVDGPILIYLRSKQMGPCLQLYILLRLEQMGPSYGIYAQNGWAHAFNYISYYAQSTWAHLNVFTLRTNGPMFSIIYYVTLRADRPILMYLRSEQMGPS